jgi:hypothetical protein
LRGEIPLHPGLESFIDTASNVCTSLLVDGWLGGHARKWAIAAAFGDNLAAEARQLAERSELDGEQTRVLEELGVRLNYNAYGEVLSDLHVAPAELADDMIDFPDRWTSSADPPSMRRSPLGTSAIWKRRAIWSPPAGCPAPSCSNCQCSMGPARQRYVGE